MVPSSLRVVDRNGHCTHGSNTYLEVHLDDEEKSIAQKKKQEKSNTHPEIQGNLVQIVATLCSEIAFHRIEQTSRRSEEEVQDYLEE